MVKEDKGEALLAAVKRRLVTEEFIFGRRAWPAYPMLPVANVLTEKTGSISAHDRHAIQLEGGGQDSFQTVKLLLDAGWRVAA